MASYTLEWLSAKEIVLIRWPTTYPIQASLLKLIISQVPFMTGSNGLTYLKRFLLKYSFIVELSFLIFMFNLQYIFFL